MLSRMAAMLCHVSDYILTQEINVFFRNNIMLYIYYIEATKWYVFADTE